MLYLDKIEDAQVLFVPRNGKIPDGEVKFVAFSTIDRSVEIDLPSINLDISALYMHLAVTVPDGCPTGEFEYTVTAGGEPVSTGLLIIGENFRMNQYEKTVTYEQYETE